MIEDGGESGLPREAANSALLGILRADFTPAERQRIAGEVGELIDDMLRQGRQRSEPMREIHGRIGDKWSVLLLLLLRIATLRHATLRRLVSATSAEGSISQRMLTLRLRALERDGLIGRTASDDVPPRIDYFITPMGRSLMEEIERLMAWVKRHNAAIRASQEAFDARNPARPSLPDWPENLRKVR